MSKNTVSARIEIAKLLPLAKKAKLGSATMSSEHKRMHRILKKLKPIFADYVPLYPFHDAFKCLVCVVLSQKTTITNARRAYQQLISKYDTPKKLSQADVRVIIDLIKPAGLYRTRAKKLKELSNIICEKYRGNLDDLLSGPVGKIRKKLLSLPLIGRNAADCMLLFATGQNVIPIDTNIHRVAVRLGFVSEGTNYEGVQRRLRELTSAEKAMEVHLFLINLGRHFCKARKPLCPQCPVATQCLNQALRAH